MDSNPDIVLFFNPRFGAEYAASDIQIGRFNFYSSPVPVSSLKLWAVTFVQQSIMNV